MVEGVGPSGAEVASNQDPSKFKYPCSHCLRRFQRPEHVTRHERTHTGELDFVCATCGKEFNRSDVLKRHMRTHDRPDDPNAAPKNARKQAAMDRISKACILCASSKMKCNGESPCDRCTSSGKDCVFPEPGPRSKRARLASSAPADGMEGAGSSGGASEASPVAALPPASQSLDLEVLPKASTITVSASTSTATFEPAPIQFANTFATSSQFSAAYDPTLMLAADPGPSTSLPPAVTPFNAGATPQADGFGLLFSNETSTNFLYETQDSWWSTLFSDGDAGDPGFGLSLDSVNFSFPQLGGATPAPLPTIQPEPKSLPAAKNGTEGLFWASVDGLSALRDAAKTPPTHLGFFPDKTTDEEPFMNIKNLQQDAHAPSPAGTTPGTGPLTGRSHESHVSQRDRIIVSVAGVATRHQTPEPGAEPLIGTTMVGDWPMMGWNPAKEDSSLRITADFQESPANAAPSGKTTLVPAFDEDARLSLLETLRFAELAEREYHRLYQTLCRIQLATYDACLQAYFAHFQPVFPFLHVATFNPKRTNGFLMLSILGIGSLYVAFPGASQFAEVLLEISRRGTGHLMVHDNRLSRDLPMVQSILLWSTIRWLGSSRLLELSQVFRNTFCTCLRELRLFDTTPRPEVLPPTATLKQRWNSWILAEERKRTALAAFALESENVQLLGFVPSIAVHELRVSLPCDEALWTSASPEQWATLIDGEKETGTLSVTSALQTLKKAGKGKALANGTIFSNPFANLVLFKSLHVMAFPLEELRACGFDAGVEKLSDDLRKSLLGLARGAHEFATTYAQDESAFSSSIVIYHLAQITARLPVNVLLDVSGRRPRVNTTGLRATVEKVFSDENGEGRTLALHAGQIFRVLRNSPRRATHEPMSLFFAALVLHFFARELASQPADALAGPECQLDEVQAVSPNTWLANGGPSSLAGVGSLATQHSAREVLVFAAGMLSRQAGAVWRIGESLGKVLLAMAELEVEQPPRAPQ